MKKSFLLIMAVGGLMLTNSCEKEEFHQVALQDEQEVVDDIDPNPPMPKANGIVVAGTWDGEIDEGLLAVIHHNLFVTL